MRGYEKKMKGRKKRGNVNHKFATTAVPGREEEKKKIGFSSI